MAECLLWILGSHYVRPRMTESIVVMANFAAPGFDITALCFALEPLLLLRLRHLGRLTRLRPMCGLFNQRHKPRLRF